MYRLSPSGDWIGQPSSDGVFSSELLPPISSIFCAAPQAESATAAPARLTAAAIPRVERTFMVAPFTHRDLDQGEVADLLVVEARPDVR